MTKEEKDLAKKLIELNNMVYMLLNKINVLHQLLPKNAEIDQAFQKIEETFKGLPETKVDYESDRQT